jgi:hypothetical protein
VAGGNSVKENLKKPAARDCMSCCIGNSFLETTKSRNLVLLAIDCRKNGSKIHAHHL